MVKGLIGGITKEKAIYSAEMAFINQKNYYYKPKKSKHL